MLAKHYHKDIKVRRLGLDQWPRQEFSYLPDAGFGSGVSAVPSGGPCAFSSGQSLWCNLLDLSFGIVYCVIFEFFYFLALLVLSPVTLPGTYA